MRTCVSPVGRVTRCAAPVIPASTTTPACGVVYGPTAAVATCAGEAAVAVAATTVPSTASSASGASILWGFMRLLRFAVSRCAEGASSRCSDARPGGRRRPRSRGSSGVVRRDEPRSAVRARRGRVRGCTFRRMRWRATRRVQPFADWALAGAMAVYGLTAGAVEGSPLSLGGSQSIVGPHPVVAVSFGLAGIVLAFRQRMPLAVLGAVMIVIGVPAAIFGSSEGFSPIAPIFVALYSVGAHAKISRALAALGLFAGFWTMLALRDPLNHTLSAVLWSWPAFLVGVMLLLLGAFLRTRRLYVAELRARAEQAESEREERIRAATADERARIARELHDAVAHAMTVMVMQAEAADEMLDVDPIRARRALERVQSVGRDGLAEMRRLLGVRS